MTKLRVGILGCGKMGQVYADWFSRHPHCQLVAFYNRTFSRAEALAQEYPGARARQRWQEITGDAGVDIIGICTPSHEHLDQLKTAVTAGKHVLCEKPMARNVAECRRMCEIAASSSVKVAIGFQMRFHPVVQKVDELLPRLGEVFHLDFVFGMYRPENTWRHLSLQEGGVLKELGTHLVDLASHWAGEVTSVFAQNRIITPLREVEDYTLNLFEFSGTATGYLFSNYYDRRGRSIMGNIFGSQGQIHWQFSSYDAKDSRLLLYTDAAQKEIPLNISADIDRVYPGHLDSFRKEIDHFVDCILNDKKPLTGTAEGLKSIEVVRASYQSAKEKKRITLGL